MPTHAMTIAEVHAEIDRVIAKLEAAKARRGGTLRVELSYAAERLVKLSYPAIDAK